MGLKQGYKQTEVGIVPEDWDIKKLGDVFQFLITANNSRSDLSNQGEVKYIHYGDIHTKWKSFLDCENNYLPLIQRDKVTNIPFLEDGDLVMADASEDYEGIGISVEVKNATGRKVVAGLHTFLLRGNKAVLADGFKGYLQYLPAVKASLRKAATGISVYGISKNNVKNISISLPCIEEQQAIATALSDVDALLTSLDKLIAKKRDIKQAVMQQLLTGKARLPGFSGEWDEKTLGGIVEKIIGGGTPSRSNSVYWNGNIPWVTVKDFATFNPYFAQESITEIGLENSASHLIKRGTIITSTRMALGKAVIYKVDVSINQDLKAIFLKRDMNILFTYYWFEQNAKLIEGLGNGSTVKGVSLSDLRNVPFLKPPTLKEQEAIATVLFDLDAEITALEKKRDKTRLLKQGMMQELLTGKTRLL